MKKLKPLIFVLFLLFCISIHSQTKNSVINVYELNSAAYNLGQSYAANYQELYKSSYTLAIYNSTTNLYDTYSARGDAYIYSGSTNLYKPDKNFITTLILGDNSIEENNTVLEQRSILLDDNVSYRVRDSFNPHGASNMSEALIGGVFGLLFQ